MSDANPKLGLGNQLKAETEILHTTLASRKSLGRVADLMSAWVAKQHPGAVPSQSGFRILCQALLEFVTPETKNELGYFEFAIESGQAFFSARVAKSLMDVNTAAGIESFEKEVTQFWMNSPKTILIRKNLGANDRVEIRHHSQLNVTEWRVIHRFAESTDAGIDEASAHLQSSFSVFLDGSENIRSDHPKMLDLGDLPYDSLLSEVYRSSGNQNQSSSGDLHFQGQSVQGEDEAARLKFEQEIDEVESDVVMQSDDADDSDSQLDSYLEKLVRQMRADQVEIKDQAKEAIREAKQNELRAKRETQTLEHKIKKYEELLKRKELVNARSQNQMRILNEKITELNRRSGGDANASANIKAFRDKALQMHAMLVKVKAEKEAIEKLLIEKNQAEAEVAPVPEMSSELPAEVSMGRAAPIQKSVQLDEMTKKTERLQRALEAEKVKVKQLSERITVAERESQAAVPMVKDLESKVDQALKLAQQNKKESDGLKQKVVQAEQEKNKVMNELSKAQAQIATLQKRQAG
jgi:hypothetical protein